jgi:hypothetical protein
LYESLSRPFKAPWKTGSGTVLSDWDDAYDPALDTTFNFGFRAEGTKILDMITIAAVYKYAYSALKKTEAIDPNDIIDEKVGNHAFGLYVNLTPIPGLGISVGYSGLIKTWENEKYKDTVIDVGVIGDDHYLSQGYRETLFPYYSGIDLRAVYSGFQNMSITFNNNVSFARMKGTKNRDEIFAHGWAYSGMLNEPAPVTPGVPNRVPFRSEDYLGLYNALGANYKINDTLAVDLQLANRLAVFSLQWEGDPLSSVTNSFGVYAGATYPVYQKDKFHAGIRGGLDLKLNTYSYQDDSALRSVHHAGYLDFGIPIAVKVVF